MVLGAWIIVVFHILGAATNTRKQRANEVGTEDGYISTNTARRPIVVQ
jgi:hypothetical protein